LNERLSDEHGFSDSGNSRQENMRPAFSSVKIFDSRDMLETRANALAIIQAASNVRP
jgi:hypothetical protein